MPDTITESELTALIDKHYNDTPKSLVDVVRLVVRDIGITVVPDPIPEPEGDVIVVDKNGFKWTQLNDGGWTTVGVEIFNWGHVVSRGPVKIYRLEGEAK